MIEVSERTNIRGERYTCYDTGGVVMSYNPNTYWHRFYSRKYGFVVRVRHYGLDNELISITHRGKVLNASVDISHTMEGVLLYSVDIFEV